MLRTWIDSMLTRRRRTNPAQRARLEYVVADVKPVLGDAQATDDFALALWCKLTGLPPEEAERRAAERLAAGKPLAQWEQTKFDSKGRPTHR